MRCKNLAVALKKKGINSLFLFDVKNRAVEEIIPRSVGDSIFIYSGESDYKDNFHSDLQRTIRILQDNSILNIVIDHYSIDIDWELGLRNQMPNAKLVIIDDLARHHSCDFLFDSKPVKLKRYSDLPKHAKVFEGPQFAMLSEEYIGAYTPPKKRDKCILISLGGGGDLNSIYEYTKILIHSDSLKDTFIDVVIGPSAIGVEPLISLSKDNTRLRLIRNQNSLLPFFKTCGLFVGALGTSLYELSACGTPSLTFSIAQNQNNDISDLESLGHFFHLNSLPNVPQKLASLTEVLFSQRSRITDLVKSASVTVDGLGAERVATLIEGGEDFKESLRSEDQIKMSSPAPVFFNGSLSVRKVSDKDINNYLAARNLQINSSKMTITEKIDRLDHYLWWFNNNRDSYVVEFEGKVVLYIWHQEKCIDDKDYLIGGWFSARDDVGFDKALFALNWQLKHTKEIFPNHTWLAVINKENHFVNLLNKYMGFKASEGNDLLMKHTQELFPLASTDEFNYVYL